MARRLSLDETLKCLKAWRENKDKDALTLLTICNFGLVIFFAKKYLENGLTYDELVSAGNEGLIKAINKFDYKEKDIRGFSTYVCTAIQNSIRFDIKMYKKHSKVLSYEQPIGKNDDGNDITLKDILGTDADELIENVISEMKIDIVKEALKSLTLREQQIILLRYGLDDTHKKTQEEVAQIFGCTRACISTQEQRALIKMRHPRNTKKLKELYN